MSCSTDDLLTEFAHILKRILPSDIGKSFRYESRGEKFLFFLNFSSDDSIFQSKKVRKNFDELLDGLNAVCQLQKNPKGENIAVYSFDVTPKFLAVLGNNIELWGLLHPFKAVRIAWGSSKEIKGI